MRGILTICIWLLLTVGAFAQVTNRFAFPAYAGVKFREGNIVQGTNDTGNPGYYGNGAANYYDMTYFWDAPAAGPTPDQWDNWIYPQIVADKNFGFNCARLMWSCDAIVGDSSHHGVATWVGATNFTQLYREIDMFCNASASNGLACYLTATDSRVITDGNITSNNVYTYISNFCARAVLHDNVIGIDVVQELDGTSSSSNAMVAINAKQWIAAARDGMNASGRRVPVTCSLNGAANAGDLNLGNRYEAYVLAAAGVDFLDCHIYYQLGQADWIQTVTNIWNLPVICGETGIPMNGLWGQGQDNEASHPYGSEKITDFFFAAQGMGMAPYHQLMGVWAVGPNSPTNSGELDFSVYSGVYSNGFTIPRERQRNVLAWTTNTAVPNAAWSLVTTGANTTAANYSTHTRYAVQSGMLDNYNGGTIWQINAKCLQQLGNTVSLGIADDSAVLYESTLPNATGNTVQFDIPPQSPTRYSTYLTWEPILRCQPNGDNYLVALTSDTANQYDNTIVVYKYVSGTKTQIAAQSYTNSFGALDMTKWWRLSVSCSTGVSPTTITCTLSNITTGTLMTPILTVNDSSATLQAPGWMGLNAYLGYSLYTNIFFTQQYDNAPTVKAAPTGTPSGANVSLSWNAAVLGSGTINYTPQYNVADAFGFPSTTTWTNGTQTTSTSQTLNSLPSNTNILFRVQTVDATGATNYSPWQVVATSSSGSTVPTYLPFRTY